MSGWHPGDKFVEENVGTPFPAVNNITVGGYMPSDQVPSPSNPTFLTLYSKVKNFDRSAHEESETVQEVVQVYALHYSLEWVQKVHKPRTGKTAISSLLETEQQSEKYR